MAKLRSLAQNILAADEEDLDKAEDEEEDEEGEEEEEGNFPAHAGLALLAEKVASGEPLDAYDLEILDAAREEEALETPKDMALESPEVQAAEELLGTEAHDEGEELPPPEATEGDLADHLEGSTEEEVLASAEGLADSLEEEAELHEEEISQLEEEEEPDEEAIAAGKARVGILRSLSKALLSGDW